MFVKLLMFVSFHAAKLLKFTETGPYENVVNRSQASWKNTQRRCHPLASLIDDVSSPNKPINDVTSDHGLHEQPSTV